MDGSTCAVRTRPEMLNVPRELTRRGFLAGTTAAGTGAAAGLASVTAAHGAEGTQSPPSSIRYCLNTSTLRGQKLTIAEEVKIAGEVGYDALEPWISELDE